MELNRGSLLQQNKRGRINMTENRPILKNKMYLYLTEFFAGILLLLVVVYFVSSRIPLKKIKKCPRQ